MLQRSLIAMLVAIALCCAAAPAAEMVDNPQYTSWAKHKAGSKITMKQDMAMGPMTINNNATQTLIEVTPEKVIVEYAMTVDVGGQKHESKNKQEIAAKVEKGKEFMPPNVKGTIKDAGTEKIEIAGKSYDCKVMEFTGEGEQGKSSGKMWHSVEVPGALAKLDMKMEAPQQGSIKMVVTQMEMK